MNDRMLPYLNHEGDLFYVHSTAIVESGAKIGGGTRIWHFAHVRGSAVIGRQCNIGKGAYIEGEMGDHCKIQNNVNVYHGVTLGNYVFMGPNSTTTNDLYPDAMAPEWLLTKTLIGNGAAVGAGSVVVCGITLGERCLIGAGSTVRTNVPKGEIWAGNPAKKLRKRADL